MCHVSFVRTLFYSKGDVATIAPSYNGSKSKNKLLQGIKHLSRYYE